MADKYDFQIDTLKFRMATSDKFPYVRSTADFRKEQFDTSATVGDQSLTGWWTRGQLSFHLGAGLNYYEVLESETVLNRFKESEHVKVFEPGEVTLDRLSTALPSHVDFTGIVKAIPGFAYSAYGRLWALDRAGYALLYTDTSTTPDKYVANDTTAIRAHATHDSSTFFATSNHNIERWVGASYISVSYTHTQFIMAMFVVKDRLWVFDNAGALYVVAAYPAAPPVALSSPICTIVVGDEKKASFADGGGAVFMSAGANKIYAFVPANDGSLAVLTAPVTAAVLPDNENIASIQAHMGVLTIATSRGVRFAAIAGDNLTVGPLVVEWSTSACTNIGTRDSFVYVTGEDSTSSTLCYEFDLSRSVGGDPLVFPYRLAWRGSQSVVDSGSHTGAVSWLDGMVFWGGDTATEKYLEGTSGTTLEPTGYVKTAYHRFGTLDNKRFLKVVVRAKGTGTIQVYQVDADGTETSLGTMNASAGVATFAIAETDAVERMAFKFVLNRATTTTGPTLLGYQVKALPVPERHELLRVPLVIADYVALRHGTRVGTQGKGYSDLKALKALETAQAIVTFTDHRTGETGTAYIDKVDFQSDTPATANDTGFGGVAYVTLRVL